MQATEKVKGLERFSYIELLERFSYSELEVFGLENQRELISV